MVIHPYMEEINATLQTFKTAAIGVFLAFLILGTNFYISSCNLKKNNSDMFEYSAC